MKQYLSLGELLVDFRNFNKLSQADVAAVLNVDIRSVIRWEKDETLVKSDKEKELVDKTFIPYQVIHNLNATVPIPTYYDFRIRKYSLTAFSNKLPDADWFKKEMGQTTARLRTIETEANIQNILRYQQYQSPIYKPVDVAIIREAVKLLPELNLILVDTAGYYCGHCVFFPIAPSTFEQLKNRDLQEGQILPHQLVDYRKQEVPHFHALEITADCNENMYYLLGAVFTFFKNLQAKNYVYSNITTRYDSFDINKQLGIKIIWEDHEEQKRLGLEFPPRFYMGTLIDFFREE